MFYYAKPRALYASRCLGKCLGKNRCFKCKCTAQPGLLHGGLRPAAAYTLAVTHCFTIRKFTDKSRIKAVLRSQVSERPACRLPRAIATGCCVYVACKSRRKCNCLSQNCTRNQPAHDMRAESKFIGQVVKPPVCLAAAPRPPPATLSLVMG